MNIFRFFGDLAHLASIFILLHKIQLSKSCRGGLGARFFHDRICLRRPWCQRSGALQSALVAGFLSTEAAVTSGAASSLGWKAAMLLSCCWGLGTLCAPLYRHNIADEQTLNCDSSPCTGISFKTQLLYTVVFVARYLDLFFESSLYRVIMKCFFIGSSVYVLYLMRVKYR